MRNILLVLMSVMVCLLVLEVAVHIYSGFVFPKMMVLDKKLGWRHAANVGRIFINESGEKVRVIQNTYGHRGSARGLEKDPGVFRVLALGDSFTEGVQVSEKEVVTEQLELAGADSHLEVLNAGVGGYGTVQEYLYLASEGLKFHPDLVLLMFYENDLTDNGLSYYPGFGPRPYARIDGDTFQIIETLNSSAYEKFILPVPFRMELNNYSYLYYFVNSRIYQPLLAKQLLKLQQADLRRLDVATRYKLFFKVLEKIHALVAERKIPFLLVVIPSREDAAKGSSELAATIQQLCRERNIKCLSLLGKFHQEIAAGRRLYFQEDMHWTKEGHKLAADEIVNYIGSIQNLTLNHGQELADKFY